MNDYDINSVYGCPEYCCHATATAYTNWTVCELVENRSHTWYENCKYLRETGRCKHP